jgi:hypothetical protein
MNWNNKFDTALPLFLLDSSGQVFIQLQKRVQNAVVYQFQIIYDRA